MTIEQAAGAYVAIAIAYFALIIVLYHSTMAEELRKAAEGSDASVQWIITYPWVRATIYVCVFVMAAVTWPYGVYWHIRKLKKPSA